MEDQQKELIREWKDRIDSWPPELVYPFVITFTLKKDCSDYGDIKPGRWAEMKDSKTYACGEVVKVEDNVLIIAYDVVPLADEEILKEKYKVRMQKAMEKFNEK